MDQSVEKLNKALSGLLKGTAKARGWDAPELARRIGRDVGLVASWLESPTRTPGRELFKLADELGLRQTVWSFIAPVLDDRKQSS